MDNQYFLYVLLKYSISINFRSTLTWHLMAMSSSSLRVNKWELMEGLTCYNVFNFRDKSITFFFNELIC